MAGRVRVRYAPSPTGEPHVGNIRTALFDWLFARNQGGDFVVRVEDTDQSRQVEGAVEEQLESLRWLGLYWDEGPSVGGPFGPYHQSERLQFYHDVTEILLNQGYAYRCYCSPERLTEIRKGQSGYDGACRFLSEKERRKAEQSDVMPAVRFAMPREGITAVNDVIRGHVSFENVLTEDFVIMKADGFPTYHLAVVVDDHHMKISHTFRGEDWLSSLPRHVQLYRALGWQAPYFAHLPNILAKDKSKLSKRHGATSILEFRKMGYLPEALINFLSLLGWSLDDKTEIISRDDLVANFDIMRVNKASGVFDVDKLRWMNGYYIRQLGNEGIVDALMDYWLKYPPEQLTQLPQREVLLSIMPLIHERMKTLCDAAPLISFFFSEDIVYEVDAAIQKGMTRKDAAVGLKASLQALESVQNFDSTSVEHSLRSVASDLGLKVGQLLGTIRVVVTGQNISPPLFESLAILGRDRTLDAIRGGITRFEK